MVRTRKDIPAVADLFGTNNLCVEQPTVEQVLDLMTGEVREAVDVIGADRREAQKLRLDLSARACDNSPQSPQLVCPICHVPVRLVCTPDQQRLFFRHAVVPGACPQLEAMPTKEQINAAKYNGAKESQAHKDMKELVGRSLAADRRFAEIASERVVKGAVRPWEWRKPDVQARWNRALMVAFEVQLSTTFLHVIAARREFYRSGGWLLFWVFQSFDLEAEYMTGLDVFHANRCNAFVVDAETCAKSESTSRFHLRCLWPVPKATGGKLEFSMHSDILPFDQLQLNVEDQAAYHFDFDAQAAVARQQLAIDRFWQFDDWENVQAARILFQDLLPGFTPRDNPQLRRIMDLGKGLHSARQGKPVGWDFTTTDQVFHLLHDQHGPLLVAVCSAFKQWGRDFKDSKGKIAARKLKVIGDIRERQQNSQYYPDRDIEPLFELVAPDAYVAYRSACQKLGLF